MENELKRMIQKGFNQSSQTSIKISNTMYNWQCKKCGTLVTQDHQPSANGCPKGGLHSWNKL